MKKVFLVVNAQEAAEVLRNGVKCEDEIFLVEDSNFALGEDVYNSLDCYARGMLGVKKNDCYVAMQINTEGLKLESLKKYTGELFYKFGYSCKEDITPNRITNSNFKLLSYAM